MIVHFPFRQMHVEVTGHLVRFGNLLDDDVLSNYLEVLISKTDNGRELGLIAHGTKSECLLERINHV